MLGLQSEAAPVLIYVTSFPGDRAVEKVSRVELHSGLGREDVERPPRVWLEHVDSVREAGARPVQHEVVVVSSSVLELRVRPVDPGADWRRSSKVETSVLHARQLAGRDQGRVDRRVAV